MKLPESIINAVKESKSEQEAFDKIAKIKNISSDIAIAFRKRYDPERKLTKQQAFAKLYAEFKK